MAADSVISFQDFLSECPDDYDNISLAFDNVGAVRFTTITRANLELLKRARETGHAGIIVSCPDFERECIAISFLAALLHLEHDIGSPGLHGARAGERVAIGHCVAVVTDANGQRVMFRTADESGIGFDRRYTNPPLVHTAPATAPLSKTRSTPKRKKLSLKQAASQYEKLPIPFRHFLDLCGKPVSPVGYCSSPSQYLNEPPTHISNGSIAVGDNTTELSQLLPITHFQSNGKAKSDFDWPFAALPSLLIGPRIDGVGTSSPFLGAADGSAAIDFVSFNIPSSDSLESTMYTDFLDLREAGVGIIGFCDRWTMDSIRRLEDEGFLFFDWGDCSLAEQSGSCTLTPIQQTIRSRRQEKVIPVQDGDSGLWRAKQILYDHLAGKEYNTDEALGALGDIFSALGAAIRMTEAPDEEYSLEQREVLDDALDVISQSRSLSAAEFDELTEACDILRAIYQPGRRLPKEQRIYDLITDCIENKQRVVLVVDRNRTAPVYSYWCGELAYNGYGTKLFSVLNTRDFMASKGLRGNETVIFSGWYDRGTMDRALHSGIAANSIFVLYGHDSGGLELEWWTRADKQWKAAAARCFNDTNKTLSALGIAKMPNGQKRTLGSVTSPNRSDTAKEHDESPSGILTSIERRRIQGDLAKAGEKSVRATPVMFNDGSHIWLRSIVKKTKGGRLVVITDCLDGRDTEPEQKTAAALLPGDVVLRTHSDTAYIRKTSEQITKGYDDVFSRAQRWRKPIQAAQRLGLTDADITDRIYAEVRGSRTKQAVRGWVKGNRIAPQTTDDIRAVYAGLNYPISDDEFNAITQAVKMIRNKHRAVGRMAAKDMVAQFLSDVRTYGLDDAVKGFDDRHEAGDVELLKVTSIGSEMNVATDRAYIM